MNGFGCARGRGRMKKNRIVSFQSDVKFFKPAGIPNSLLKEVVLFSDEIESLRLKNIEKLDIIKGSQEMGISKSTFARIYNSAIDKIADAIINSKSIKLDQPVKLN